MPSRVRTLTCLLIAPAIIAGCGSSKSKSATTIESTPTSAANTGASGTTTKSGAAAAAKPPSGSKTATTTATSPAPAPQVTAPTHTLEISPAKKREIQAAVKRLHEGKIPPPPVYANLARVPKSKQFPKEVQEKFMAECTAGAGSKANCECLIAKFELAKFPQEQSIAEFAYFEVSRRKGFAQPPRITKRVVECKKA